MYRARFGQASPSYGLGFCGSLSFPMQPGGFGRARSNWVADVVDARSANVSERPGKSQLADACCSRRFRTNLRTLVYRSSLL